MCSLCYRLCVLKINKMAFKFENTVLIDHMALCRKVGLASSYLDNANRTISAWNCVYCNLQTIVFYCIDCIIYVYMHCNIICCLSDVIIKTFGQSVSTNVTMQVIQWRTGVYATTILLVRSGVDFFSTNRWTTNPQRNRTMQWRQSNIADLRMLTSLQRTTALTVSMLTAS